MTLKWLTLCACVPNASGVYDMKLTLTQSSHVETPSTVCDESIGQTPCSTEHGFNQRSLIPLLRYQMVHLCTLLVI